MNEKQTHCINEAIDVARRNFILGTSESSFLKDENQNTIAEIFLWGDNGYSIKDKNSEWIRGMTRNRDECFNYLVYLYNEHEKQKKEKSDKYSLNVILFLLFSLFISGLFILNKQEEINKLKQQTKTQINNTQQEN